MSKTKEYQKTHQDKLTKRRRTIKLIEEYIEDANTIIKHTKTEMTISEVVTIMEKINRDKPLIYLPLKGNIDL